ncbi:tetratricopeptide repeat protein [Planctomicrobium piriforme]|uniref:Tetratricopeptide repeat-containing protein n=1 Tax=Planctomicrobium piriforme TaxID=1576369 RepID=A0A1I3N9F7_9PLAN|nr:hypothetical protein [Planctomicrobium piriforme]SFJ05852.1 hypothetical protein SAMN05421753_11535 [Planctomicrobium piriforme]
MPESFIDSPLLPVTSPRSRRLAAALASLLFTAPPLLADSPAAPSTTAAPSAATPAAAPLSPEEERQNALSTAVALNYCRASFHRIRKDQTDETLREEQEKILNNLNLSQLNDPEVIALYTSVLDEIGQIGMADKERSMYGRNHVEQVRRQITWDAVAFGTDLMTAQFGSAVKTGANSWWDYRSSVFQRDITIHKIEKDRVTAVVQRSNQFLDTFWKLARKKNIPDRWLVRGDDLDQLEVAMQERDGEVRLRILRRMEPFMEAYPPYWYYLARTQQELGKLTDAVDIYGRLEQLGSGHFRKDELLATAMANQAAIQDFLGDARALASAKKALDYSTDVWEANLMAARVLQRNGQIASAEDAILRNLDVELEQSQSHVFLASLYFFSRQEDKLTAMLNDPKAVAHLPAPVLLRCAALIGVEKTPPLVVNNILASLEAYPRTSLGSETVLVRVGNVWQLHLARLDAFQDGKKLNDPQVQGGKGYYDLRYASHGDRAFPLGPQTSPKELTLVFTYPDETVVRLALQPNETPKSSRTGMSLTATPFMRISSIKVGDETFALRPRDQRATPERIETAKPSVDDAAIPNLRPDPTKHPSSACVEDEFRGG